MRYIQTFTNKDFGDIDIVLFSNKEYFNATQIAEILGYINPRDALKRHCKGVVNHDTLKNKGGYALKMIPEGDLYRLIVKSKLPSAEKFERWVFAW